MKEKDIQVIFGKKNKVPGIFELKLCKTKSIRFDAVRSHQLDSLLAVSTVLGLYHKIADQTIGRKGCFGHTLKKPFDCFFLRNVPAYIVICFYEARKSKVFYYISPQEWIKADTSSIKKSINEDKINEISKYVYDTSTETLYESPRLR